MHCWNVCVQALPLAFTQSTPCNTMPIHEVPAYAHWPNSHFPHGWCTIMCPPYTFPLTFCHFPAPRHCHACSESGHIAAFGHSCPPCHPQPGVTPLQHWPQRPFFWEAGTLIEGPPPLSSYPFQRFAHMHTSTSTSSHIALHLDLPICPCHSTTQGSLAHHWPQRPSFPFVGAPIKCPPPPPISLWHSLHAHMHAF